MKNHPGSSKRANGRKHASRKRKKHPEVGQSVDGQRRKAAAPSSTVPSDKTKGHALRDSHLDARVIFRAIRDADGQVCDFLFAEANKAACTYNHLTRERLVGHCLLELFPNTKKTGLFDMYVRLLETGETLELESFRYPHDLRGETTILSIRAIPVGDELACTWGEVDGQSGSDGDGVAPRPSVLERRKNNSLTADAEAQIREFQALAQNLLELREQEQQDISRELHDNIAQVLSAVTNRISLARRERIPAWLRQELQDLREHLQTALADVRTLARELRPSVLDHRGFAAALEKHAEAFRERTRMTLDIAVVPEAVSFLDNGDLTHLFRLTQEALQNIEDHSGARNAWINLCQCDGVVKLEIGDDGCSFSPERVVEAQKDGHLGLLGMRERAELLGGKILLDAVPAQGTVITLTIPPPPKNSARKTP